ncbi:uncharacterized protein [Nicotiana sylvestris]|uniref:uncharacterized protein n=1 Tax=Nicotiana sylvestris TaxID=4096 RepID=UPI00388C6894
MRSSRAQGNHEGHDIFQGCLAGLEDGSNQDAFFIFEQAAVLQKREFSKSQDDLARCEVELKKTLEDRDAVKALYAKKELEIHNFRAELTRVCQDRAVYIGKFSQKIDVEAQLWEELKIKEADALGLRRGMDDLASEKENLKEQLASFKFQLRGAKEESLARGLEIEELKIRSAAMLAKAKSDVMAIMASYRADAKATNAREREISSTTEVKLASALDHVRRQSRRMTLEEILARDFDLSADIEAEKALEEEATVLLTDEDDSASAFEDERDRDEAAEDGAPQDTTPEDATAKGVAPK